MEYKIINEKKRKFILIQNKKQLWFLQYQDWFNLKANLQACEKDLNFDSKGFWNTSLELKDKNKTLLQAKMNRKFEIIIKTKNEEKYLLKPNMLWNKFILQTKQWENLLELEASFKLKKFDYEYKINSSEKFEQFKNKEILALSAVHFSNYIINQITIVAWAWVISS